MRIRGGDLVEKTSKQLNELLNQLAFKLGHRILKLLQEIYSKEANASVVKNRLNQLIFRRLRLALEKVLETYRIKFTYELVSRFADPYEFRAVAIISGGAVGFAAAFLPLCKHLLLGGACGSGFVLRTLVHQSASFITLFENWHDIKQLSRFKKAKIVHYRDIIKPEDFSNGTLEFFEEAKTLNTEFKEILRIRNND